MKACGKEKTGRINDSELEKVNASLPRRLSPDSLYYQWRRVTQSKSLDIEILNFPLEEGFLLSNNYAKGLTTEGLHQAPYLLFLSTAFTQTCI